MAHIHEKVDFVADTYVVNDGAVLLRVHDKHKIWLPPGGHVELDEDPVQAALREVKEEVGLDVELIGERQAISGDKGTNLLAPRFLNRHRINDTHEHVACIYFATSDSREILEQEEERSGGIRWFSREELGDPSYGVTPEVQFYAKAALDAAR
jgi:8-oxo-dGTP pyrophosphatase MutT (NUDIX family)